MKKWQKIKPQCFCFRSNQILTSNTNLPNEDSDISNEYEKYMEEEFNKPALNDFTLSEYTEKVIQYGYLMLFASAFPLAPLIAMASNLIDLRVDARRLLWFNRRPVPERAEDIGMWFTILSFLNYVGMITNAFIIGLISRFAQEYKTSNKHSLPLNTTLLVDFNSTTSFHINTNSTTNVLFSVETFQNLWIIIIFENVALAVKFLVAYLIPDEPEKITRAKKAEKIHMEKLLSRNGLKSGPGKSIRAS